MRMTVDDLLIEARGVLPHRPGPAEALAAQAAGALLIDIRATIGAGQRLIPGALVLPRNSLEWRCDPASQSRRGMDRRRHPIGERACGLPVGNGHLARARPGQRRRPGRGSLAWAVASSPLAAGLGHASTPRTPRGQVAEHC